MSIPFTYYLYHIPTGKKYYGVRYRKGCSPDDLWTKYFSSSSIVKDMIREYGKDSFTYEVRRIFETGDAAIKWEGKVQRRLKVDEDDMWINRHIQSGKFKCSGHSTRAKKNISKSMTGRVMTTEHKENISKSSLLDRQHRRDNGWTMPKDATERAMITRNQRIADGIINPYSEDRNAKMSASKTGTKRKYLPDGSFIMVKV